MTDKQRLRKVYKHLISKGVADTQAGIAERVGYNVSYLSSVGSNDAPLNESFVDKLVSLDISLNKVWVMTGDGEMLNKSNDIYPVDEDPVFYQTNKISLSRNEYNELKKQISDLITTNMNLSYINRELIDSNKDLSEQIDRKNSAGTA